VYAEMGHTWRVPSRGTRSVGEVPRLLRLYALVICKHPDTRVITVVVGRVVLVLGGVIVMAVRQWLQQ
jgi:hypothetical protein